MKISTSLDGNLEMLDGLPEDSVITKVLLQAKPPFNLKDGFYKLDNLEFEFYDDPQGLLTITNKKILNIDPATNIPEFVVESLNIVLSESGVPKEQFLKQPIPFDIFVLWIHDENLIAKAHIHPEK